MGKTCMLPSPFQSISSSYVICCSVCLFLNKQRISGWKRQFSRCGLVIPYLKSAFLCGFQWVPFRRIQELPETSREFVIGSFPVHGLTVLLFQSNHFWAHSNSSEVRQRGPQRLGKEVQIKYWCRLGVFIQDWVCSSVRFFHKLEFSSMAMIPFGPHFSQY